MLKTFRFMCRLSPGNRCFPLSKRSIVKVSTQPVQKCTAKVIEQTRQPFASRDAPNRFKSVSQCNEVIKKSHTIKKARHFINVTMPRASITPDATTYDALITRLMIEGDIKGAISVANIDMPKMGIKHNKSLHKTLKLSDPRLQSMRVSLLDVWISQSNVSGTNAAWDLLDSLVEKDLADVSLFNIMLKTCKDSRQTQDIIENVMPVCDIKPDSVTYATLVTRLMLEGRVEEARKTVNIHMLKAGITANKKTQRVLNLPHSELQRMRMQMLSNWLRQGDGVELAWGLFTTLSKKNLADVIMFNVMLKACHSSEEQRYLIDVVMKANGVVPDAVTYTMLMTGLMLEGDVKAVQKVANVCIPSAKIVSNSRIQKVFALSKDELQRMRNSKIRTLLNEGSNVATKAAWTLLNKLISLNCADIDMFNSMLKVCYSAKEMKQLIDQKMKSCGVQPDITTYNILINQLKIEGDEEMLQVITQQFPEVNSLLENTLHFSENVWKDRRISQLKDLITRGGNTGLNSAWILFDKLRVRNLASIEIFNTMLTACNNSHEQLDLIDITMNEASIKPNVLTFNTLISELLKEGLINEAHDVVNSLMPIAGVEVNDDTMILFEESKLISNSKQSSSLESVSENTVENNIESGFKEMLAERIKSSSDMSFNTMLQACQNSEETQFLFNMTINENGNPPDSDAYTVLVGRMMIEGNREGARCIVEKEMPGVGVEACNRMRKLITLPNQVLQKIRTKKLQRWFDAGDVSSTDAAWNLLRKLIHKKNADVIMINTMLKAFRCSEDIRNYIEVDMPKIGITADTGSYNTLINQLLLEGDRKGAQRVEQIDMKRANVVANERTRYAQTIPHFLLMKNRVKTLNNYIKQGDIDSINAAHALFGKLLCQNSTNANMFNIMLQTCSDSQEMKIMIIRDMREAGILPNVKTFNTLIVQYLKEGNLADAHNVLKVMIPAAGITPNAFTMKLLSGKSTSVLHSLEYKRHIINK